MPARTSSKSLSKWFLRNNRIFVKLVLRILLIVDSIVFHTLLCIQNARKLFGYLLRGTRLWIVMLVRLIAFTSFLMIGWMRLLNYYFFHPLIIRNLSYGKGAKYRNLLDIYLPAPINPHEENSKGGPQWKGDAPIVIFVSGGAWTIGYKLWSALVARGLSFLGVVTVVPDYRNFPQGDIEDMLTDIRLAVEWTIHNGHRFGGNPAKITLAGQSAGAHICLSLLVHDYLRKKEKEKLKAIAISKKVENVSRKITENNSPAPLKPSQKDEGRKRKKGKGRDKGREVQEEREESTNSVSSSTSTKTEHGEQVEPLTINRIRSTVSTMRADQEAHDVVGMFQGLDGSSTPAVDSPAEPYPQLHPSKAEGEKFVCDQVSMFIGVSGPYNLMGLISHLHSRGLDSSIVYWMCRGDVAKYSPTLRLYEHIKDYAPLGASSQTAGFSEAEAMPSIFSHADSAADLTATSSEIPTPRNAKELGDEADLYSKLLDVFAHLLPNLYGLLMKNTSHYAAREGQLSEEEIQELAQGKGKRCAAPVDELRSLAPPQVYSDVLKDFLPVVLIHGSNDASVPLTTCEDLYYLLKRNGAQTALKIYDGWSHTDAIVEGPLSGSMRLFNDMLSCIELVCYSPEECTITPPLLDPVRGINYDCLSEAAKVVDAAAEASVPQEDKQDFNRPAPLFVPEKTPEKAQWKTWGDERLKSCDSSFTRTPRVAPGRAMLRTPGYRESIVRDNDWHCNRNSIFLPLKFTAEWASLKTSQDNGAEGAETLPAFVPKYLVKISKRINPF